MAAVTIEAAAKPCDTGAAAVTRVRDGLYGMTVGSDTVDDWYFEYNKDGALTKELLQAVNGGTAYKLGERRVALDKAGRRTRQDLESTSRTGYLNLVGYYQLYYYNSTKYWLTKIYRDSVENAAYQYNDNDGRMTKTTYGSGARAEYGYDKSGGLTKITHYSVSGTTVVASVAYQYDLAANVTKATLADTLHFKGDATVAYAYDGVNRLTREACAPQSSYRKAYRNLFWYDEVGNRTKLMYYDGSATATTTYLYSDRNELTKATVGGNDTIYKWDPRGNLTKKGSVEYYWDSQDHMTKVVNGNTTVEYKYDLLGRRAAKRLTTNGQQPGPWWWYFYDGLKVLFEGSDTSSNRGYYTVTPAAVGGIVSRVTPGVRRFYHYDRLGNVMAITDVNGKPYAEYTMDAFGNVLQKGTSTGYSSEFATDPQPYHLTTKEYDPDVGLYYFNARWYDPTTGRFVSKDPERNPADMSDYVFASNQPLGCVDPTGLECRWVVQSRNRGRWSFVGNCTWEDDLRADQECRAECLKYAAVLLSVLVCQRVQRNTVIEWIHKCDPPCPKIGERKWEQLRERALYARCLCLGPPGSGWLGLFREFRRAIDIPYEW